MWFNSKSIKIVKENLLRGDKMEINLNEILLNSQDRNMKERIIIFDDKGDYYIFKHSYVNRCKISKTSQYCINIHFYKLYKAFRAPLLHAA